MEEYGRIIIRGLCNSSNHLKEHFNRAVIELKERHYSQIEIEDNLRQVNDMFKDRIKALYAGLNEKYLDYVKKDKDLPKEVQYNYPRPEIESISLSYFEYPSGIKDDFPSKRKYLLKDFEEVEVAFNILFNIKQAETNTGLEKLKLQPVLKPEKVEAVFEILKDYFQAEQQTELFQLLKTGIGSKKRLNFRDNGNRLADAFKQLKKADVITQCGQKELEAWIAENFKYTYRNQIKNYTARYLNDIISTNKDKCVRPILNVKTDRVTGEILITRA